MFADAYELASKYTHPVVISLRFFDGTVEGSPAAFMALNRHGWIVTAAHVLQPLVALQEHSAEIAAYNERVRAIEQNPRIGAKEKPRQIKRLTSNPKWVTNTSHWWANDASRLVDIRILPKADLAVGRLEPFTAPPDIIYPVLKNPDQLRFGTSLCKLGFPFFIINSIFHAETGQFELPPESFPIPRFPIEGIYTREMLVTESIGDPLVAKLLETSSPGLRGQSGGPIFDTLGRVWGVQSRTISLNLGFEPEIERNGRRVKEHQFLNVGLGVHIETLVAFLQQQGIEFTLSDD